MFASFPGCLYVFAYYNAMRKTPINEKRIIWAKRRILFFIPLSIIAVVSANSYDWYNDFHKRMEEIDKFY